MATKKTSRRLKKGKKMESKKNLYVPLKIKLA